MSDMYQQQQVHPLAPSNVVPRSDQEYLGAYEESMELKKQKRKRRLAYFAAFVVFQTIIILVFALVIMRVKSPEVRLGTVNVMNKENGNSNIIRLLAQVRIKNTNFGRYKYDDSIANVTTTSGGGSVGNFVIPDGRVRLKSSKRIYIVVDVTKPSSGSGNNNGSTSGLLELTTRAKLIGKVEFMVVLKKKKSAEMDCTMKVNLSTNVVQDVICQ